VKVLLGQTAPSVDPVVLTINSSSSGDYNGPIQTVPGRTSALVKAGSGTQRLAGVNSYTGTTTVSGGTLQFGKKVSLYNNVTANWTAANIKVASGATLAFNVGGTDEFTAADIQSLAALGTATGGFADGAILGLDTTNADGGTFTYGNVLADTNGGANDLGLTKLGAGTLVLTQVNTYTGPTSVLGGELVFTQSEKLTALNIADGAIVTLGSASPASGAAFEEPAGKEVGAPLQAVPEPGAVSLLAAGMLGLLARRRR
jgi:autotransporter-associated beta strand protein